jgi:regulation of enolase protein 1 (concanavalin A-like superfamily)
MILRKGAVGSVAIVTLTLASALNAFAASPPTPWLDRDIGGPGATGSTDVDTNGVWTVQGSGADIWEDADQFHFAYQPIPGDASITARFLGQKGGDGDFSKVGLMVRENDSPGSPNVDYAMTPGQGLWAQFRPQQDALTQALGLAGPSNRLAPNLFLRLQRVGNEVAGFYSRDGSVWIQADFPPRTLPSLKAEALFGLAVCSHQDGDRITARFDQVSLQPGRVSPYGLQACGGDQSVLLQWRPLKDVVAYNVYRGPAATRDQLAKLTADGVAGASFTDTGAGLVNGTPVVYAVGAVLRGSDGSLVEGPLAAVTATPVAVPGLLGCSLNEGPTIGSAAYDAATGDITLRGSGFGFEGNVDQGYFLSRPVEGDVQITVRMTARPAGPGSGRMAGLMIRESLEADARNVLLGIERDGLLRQTRAATGGDTNQAVSIQDSALKLPIVLRLTRTGDTIRPEYSTDDGQTFQAAAPVTFTPPLSRTLYVGLAITGGTSFGSRDRTGEATFGSLAIR